MNYVLYILGTLAIVFGLIGLDGVFFHILGFVFGGSDFAKTVVGYGSGALVLWGIFLCAFGSVIGLLKQIAQQTGGGSSAP